MSSADGHERHTLTEPKCTPWAALENAPWWLPGGHAQTIWPAFFAKRWIKHPPQYRRERWHTPDGDFIDADWLVCRAEPGINIGAHCRSHAFAGHPTTSAEAQKTLLVLFHGLEGSSNSQYAHAFAAAASEQSWAMVVPHFRGCSGEINLAPRAYHSGDYEEIHWILARLSAQHDGSIHAVGISLGGNALLRWAEESGGEAHNLVNSVTAVCSPIDLAASGFAMGVGASRWLYTPMFLHTMKAKACAKLKQYPGLFYQKRLLSARTLYEFDNVFTAPLHGYKDTDDYWCRASAAPKLNCIRVPTLIINATNDPFVPKDSLPLPGHLSTNVEVWRPRLGGHCGFASGAFPANVLSLPREVLRWITTHHSQSNQ